MNENEWFFASLSELNLNIYESCWCLHKKSHLFVRKSALCICKISYEVEAIAMQIKWLVFIWRTSTEKCFQTDCNFK